MISHRVGIGVFGFSNYINDSIQDTEVIFEVTERVSGKVCLGFTFFSVYFWLFVCFRTNVFASAYEVN